MVELRKNDELINFWEFAQCAPMEFSLPESWWESGTSREEMNIMTVDIAGNICRSGFVGYEEFMKSVGHSAVKPDDKVLEIEESA